MLFTIARKPAEIEDHPELLPIHKYQAWSSSAQTNSDHLHDECIDTSTRNESNETLSLDFILVVMELMRLISD